MVDDIQIASKIAIFKGKQIPKVIYSDRYRNRRKRFGLRFNLIAGICNQETGN